MTRIHVTAELEEKIRDEILLLENAMRYPDVNLDYCEARIGALEWVLKQAETTD